MLQSSLRALCACAGTLPFFCCLTDLCVCRYFTFLLLLCCLTAVCVCVCRYFTFLVECKDPKACTILLRGASKDILSEVERNLQDAMNVARNVMIDPYLCPGGGASEMAVAQVGLWELAGCNRVPCVGLLSLAVMRFGEFVLDVCGLGEFCCFRLSAAFCLQGCTLTASLAVFMGWHGKSFLKAWL